MAYNATSNLIAYIETHKEPSCRIPYLSGFSVTQETVVIMRYVIRDDMTAYDLIIENHFITTYTPVFDLDTKEASELATDQDAGL